MSRRQSSPVLIGRAAELREAAATLQRAATGHPSVIVLTGEAGVGKTRLATAIVQRAGRRGFRVLAGSCVPVTAGTLPYGPIIQAIRALAEGPDAAVLAGDDRALLARLAPAFASPGAARLLTRHRPAASRTLLLEALSGLVRRVTAASPVLLVVEDLQWADSESLDALTYLAHSVRGARLVILLTVRTEAVTERAGLTTWLAELERLEEVDTLELEPLDRDDTARLVRSILGWSPGEAVLDAIHARTEGNPFFVEEVLQTGPGRDLGIVLAPTLRAILEERVHAVSGGAAALLDVLAVARHGLDDGLLGELAGLHGTELADALRDASGRGLLTVEHRGAHDRCLLHHALIGEAVYDGLLGPERRRLHAVLAEALEQRAAARDQAARDDAAPDASSEAPVPWAEVAGHWDAAGRADRSLRAWCRAGEEAEQAFAFRAAHDAYERALATWGAAADPAGTTGIDHLTLLSRAAWAAFLGASPGGDVPLRRRAVEEADRLGDPVAGAVARADLGFSLYAAGEPGEAEAVYREAAAAVPADPPSRARAHVLAVLGQVLMNTGRLRQSLALCDEAIAIARSLGDRGLVGHASTTCGISLAYLGRSTEAIASLELGRTIALELQDAGETGRAFLNESEVLIVSGQARRGLDLALAGIETCRRMGTTESSGQYISLHAALAAYELGDWPAAARFATDGYLGSEATNDELYFLSHVVEREVACGDWEDADRDLARMALLIPAYPAELQYTGLYATASSELALWRHDPDTAAQVIVEAIGRLERTDDRLYRIRLLRIGMRAAADRAEVARARRDPTAGERARCAADELRVRVADAVDAVREMDDGARRVADADLLGIAAEDQRLHATWRNTSWQAAAAAWTQLERPQLVAYARWREAEALLHEGERETAAVALREAAAIADRLGARPLAREVAALGRRSRLDLGVPVIAAGAAHPLRPDHRQVHRAAFELTPRELEILELVADGRTDRQIAESLFISPHTVGLHVSHILGKLDAHSRTEAAAIAYRLRIIGPAGTQPEQ